MPKEEYFDILDKILISYEKLRNDYQIYSEKLYKKYSIEYRFSAINIDMEKDFIPTKAYSKTEKSKIQSESISVKEIFK